VNVITVKSADEGSESAARSRSEGVVRRHDNFIKNAPTILTMATDIEEFESAVFLVCNAYRDLQRVNSNNPILAHIKLEGIGFQPNPTYEKKYVSPHLKNPEPRREPNGQLLLFDWVHPNLFEAKLLGLMDYYHDLSVATKTEISDRGLDRLVGAYQN